MVISTIALRFHQTPSNKFIASNGVFSVKAIKAEKAAASFFTEKQKKDLPKGNGLQRKIISCVASLLVLTRRAPRKILKPPDVRIWPLLAEIAVDQVSLVTLSNFRMYA